MFYKLKYIKQIGNRRNQRFVRECLAESNNRLEMKTGNRYNVNFKLEINVDLFNSHRQVK